MGEMRNRYDVAIVGGGLAGLTAAAFLARAGKSVALFERAERVGGRAATLDNNGFHFNFGPHALFRAGCGIGILKELGIELGEERVGGSGSKVIRNGRVHRFPGGVGSLVSSGVFPIAGRIEAGKVLAGIAHIDPSQFERTTTREWLQAEVKHPAVRDFIGALIRVSTYSNDPDNFSAGAALKQLQIASRGGVSYLSNGWQSMVDELRAKAVAAGTTIFPNRSAASLKVDSGEVRGLQFSDGAQVGADSVVLAVPPTIAGSILGESAGSRLLQWIRGAVPVQAACLDLGLRRLPRPQTTFAIGLDTPMYFSVHSRWATLGPAGSALVHAAKYLPGGADTDAKEDRREIEACLDLIQPAWKNEIAAERFLPKMTVMNAAPLASQGGMSGRPAVDAATIRNVYLAGDWVGREGLLADASFASAREAARLLIEAARPMAHSTRV